MNFCYLQNILKATNLFKKKRDKTIIVLEKHRQSTIGSYLDFYLPGETLLFETLFFRPCFSACLF